MAFTDGVDLMPPAFEEGLGVWSSGDGVPGDPLYLTDPDAAIVPADADFGACLEIYKNSATQKLRYTGETPLLPGAFVKISARVKVVSGNLPTVRVAGWAGGAGGVHVTGLDETGPAVTITGFGSVFEVSAIVSTGTRSGVDLAWGTETIYGHFGLDFTGPVGAVIRIDDLRIQDVTAEFLRDMMDWVDVRDYGAVGDGVTDNMAAFEAADADTNGREILVPAGTYYLADDVTIQSRIRFVGTLSMPDSKILSLTKNYDLPSYIDAFGDEELAFKKAIQALFNGAGHDSLDMRGRMIGIRGPLDIHAIVGNRDEFSQRRVVRNGQFSVYPGVNWDTDVVTSTATYISSDSLRLRNVQNVANIPVGALVEGNGVGREVYVTAKNVAGQTLDLSGQLYDAEGTQTYTFKRFKYILDFSGFSKLSKFVLDDVEVQCQGECSGILLASAGTGFHIRDCFITQPKDRGVSSHGSGCQGLLIDRCQFLSSEGPLLSTQRQSIGLNVNSNDAKIRNNRCSYFRHFAVLQGSGTILTGNHIYQGDTSENGVRLAGLVFSRVNARATINGNYIDNCFIEWVNEHDAFPDYSSEYSFSGMSITDNIFLCGNVAPWFSFIIVKPIGPGHFLNGLTVQGNTFRVIGTEIDNVERVDTSFADLDYNRFSKVRFSENNFNQIRNVVSSPLLFEHEQNSASTAWTIDFDNKLPFNGWAQTVEAITLKGPLTDHVGGTVFATPYYEGKQGANNDQIKLRWPQAVQGAALVRVRIDDPA